MSEIRHHISDNLLTAYAGGSLGHPFALVVAAHVSMCDECRARLEAHNAVGGALLDDLNEIKVSDGLRDAVLAGLDDDFDAAPAPVRASGVYPAPVAEMLPMGRPKWKSLGLGTRQSILYDGPEGSARLLYIPAGQAVPDHGHNGLEMTLVLQGSFHDETGGFGVGDVEIAYDDLDHCPTAGTEADCICLAATDAPLRFHSFVPRLLQPLFRI